MNRRAEPLLLALDLGTSSVRSALFDEKAQPVPRSMASAQYLLRHSADHGAELDPAILLRATRKCLQLTRRLMSQPPCAIAGSGFWHSLLGLDRRGKPLTPIYTWADARCAGDAARLRERLDERVILKRTGCMLRASFWPAKLLWLRRTEPKLFRRVARWVSPAEWVFEEIFSLRACSHSMASGTGLYNLGARDWDDELLDLVGLTTSQLNSLGDQVDEIFPAIGDGAAGNLGSGASAPGIVAINVGTSAAVRTISEGKTSPPFGLFRFVVDERRALLGGAISNGGNLHAWSRRELRLPNDRKVETLLRASLSAPSSLTILPFWVSERAPTWPETLEGAIVGLSQATTAGDILRATTAAYCYRLSEIFDRLEKVAGPVKKVVVSGGILQSPASLQILADSLGREIFTCPEQEASLRGAAVHALEQLGREIPALKSEGRVRPDRKNAARARADRDRQVQLERFFSDRAPSANS